MLQQMIIPVLIGLALFLAGMKIMEIALHQWAGPMLAKSLERFTKTPLRGMLTGAGITAILQSSSAVTVITIGLVNAGIITFPQTLGIILGTNIGTTVTTELIGLNITELAIPIMIVATCCWLTVTYIPKRFTRYHSWLTAFVKTVRCLSMAASGFACVLMGMRVMQSIVPALQDRGLFDWFLQQSQRSLFWGVIAGAILTIIIQSSSATIAITMGLASVQVISVELGIAIVLGANVGTCSTAFLASIGSSKAGQFVAWSHMMLNLGGALLIFPFIPFLYHGSILLGSTPASQLAHAQTLFNIVCSLAVLPICYLPVFRFNSEKRSS